MGTILDSVNNLSDKLGVTAREQTIKDQLDLCVERLGGEGNSVDIAESVNKFADKEDGTATFTTKTITENGTYDASDDGVSGYSSVTVDVSGGMDFSVILAPMRKNTSYFGLIKSETGEYDLSSSTYEPYEHLSTACLYDPANTVDLGRNKINNIIFTPGDDFKIIYNGNEINLTPKISGMTMTANDGLLYEAEMDYENPSGVSGEFNKTYPQGDPFQIIIV